MAEATKIRYVGPFRAVDVPALGTTVRRNHQVEIEDPAVAKALLAQSDWEEVGAKAAGKQEAPAADTPKAGG